MAEICNVHGPFVSDNGRCPYCQADSAPVVPQTVLASQPGQILGLLVRVSGDAAGQTHRIGEALLIGRDPAVAALHLEDDEVSGRHAQLTMRGGQVYVEDLGSSNGTFVNEQRISGLHTLREDDSLRCGAQTFVLKTVQL